MRYWNLPARRRSHMPGIETRAAFRAVSAVHGRKAVSCDPSYEYELARDLAERLDRSELVAQFERFSRSDRALDAMMRRVCLRALVRCLGDGAVLGKGVG